MDTTSTFPSDANGDALRRMVNDGDDLSKPRTIDFCHIFPERKQALAFAEAIDDHHLGVCISFYEVKQMWEVKVMNQMIPTHENVTALELSLANQAELLGGESDGWGCMVVKSRRRSSPSWPTT